MSPLLLKGKSCPKCDALYYGPPICRKCDWYNKDFDEWSRRYSERNLDRIRQFIKEKEAEG